MMIASLVPSLQGAFAEHFFVKLICLRRGNLMKGSEKFLIMRLLRRHEN
jgi:hypothetical protein